MYLGINVNGFIESELGRFGVTHRVKLNFLDPIANRDVATFGTIVLNRLPITLK